MGNKAIKSIGKPAQGVYSGAEDDDDEDDEISTSSSITQGSSPRKMMSKQAMDDDQEEQEQVEGAIAASAAFAQQHQQQQEQQQQQEGEQGEEGGEEGGGGGGKKKKGGFRGALGNWKEKQQRKQEMKKIKKETKKDSKKGDKIYHKHFVPKRHAQNIYNEEKIKKPFPTPVVREKEKIDEGIKRKQDIAGKIAKNEALGEEGYEQVKKLEKEYKEITKEQTHAVKRLRVELLNIDIRNSLKGPSGCAKTIASFHAIVLTIVGGTLLAILKLCGVF